MSNYYSKSASTTGAAATCDLITYKTVIHDDTAQLTCSLSDTSDDGDEVYVEWWQDGFGHIQLHNYDGAGTTITVQDARFNGDGSFQTIYFKVCRDISLWPDNCSSTKSWTVH